MLKSLAIHNLLLIEQCLISFEKGFSAITGETGAGKTALVRAIDLCLGARADTQMIRQGAAKASVAAEFEGDLLPELKELLEDLGISHDSQESLIIRREISQDGRSRCFINGAPCNVHDLQKASAFLIDIIGQQENQSLKNAAAGRIFIDLFTDAQSALNAYRSLWTERQKTAEELLNLEAASSTRQRELDFAQYELKEIEEAAVKEGEESEVQEEHDRLSHAESVMAKLTEINAFLSENPHSLLPLLQRCRHATHSIAHREPRLKELEEFLEQGRVHLTEASHLASLLVSDWEFDPNRLEHLDSRLSVIHKIQSKYGKAFAEIEAYKNKLQERIATLSSLEEKIEKTRAALKELDECLQKAAADLSAQRKKGIKQAEKEVTGYVRALNMPHSHIQILHKEIELTSYGKDQFDIFLQANAGQKPCALKEGVSGGELSRVLLAMYRTLAAKNKTPTLFFDEIDANVGGTTAVEVAKQMRDLSQDVQVICITHFPQVARFAGHHLHVEKTERVQGTYATVKTLQDDEKKQEILRMLGGEKIHL